jgi:excisionase family DNA binding protein
VYNASMPDRMYSVTVAAERLQISESHLRRLLESKKVKGYKFGRDWVVQNLKYKRKRKPKTEKGGQNNEKC